MQENRSIRCDVTGCRHNYCGENCQLGSIKITCGCGENCTCCGSYSEKE